MQVPITVGMATYEDFDGVFFTVQSLRMFHKDVDDLHILVVDNCPDGKHGIAVRKFIDGCEDPRVRYIPYRDEVSTFVKKMVFQYATTDHVLCIDCHVMLDPGAVRRLAEYYAEHPDSIDLNQGPMYSDSMKTLFTHFEPGWGSGGYGVWGIDLKGLGTEPFEIEANGMGLFSCRKDVFPGMHPLFKGFGVEEFYVHDKIRAAGGKVLCHPSLKWMHRFPRPNGVPYPLPAHERFCNYLLAWMEVGRDVKPMIEHYTEIYGAENVKNFQVEYGKLLFAPRTPPRSPI